jgi:hypothetical protein
VVLFEDFLRKHGQVDAPVAPDMTTVGLKIGVFMLL